MRLELTAQLKNHQQIDSSRKVLAQGHGHIVTVDAESKRRTLCFWKQNEHDGDYSLDWALKVHYAEIILMRRVADFLVSVDANATVCVTSMRSGTLVNRLHVEPADAHLIISFEGTVCVLCVSSSETIVMVFHVTDSPPTVDRMPSIPAPVSDAVIIGSHIIFLVQGTAELGLLYLGEAAPCDMLTLAFRPHSIRAVGRFALVLSDDGLLVRTLTVTAGRLTVVGDCIISSTAPLDWSVLPSPVLPEEAAVAELVVQTADGPTQRVTISLVHPNVTPCGTSIHSLSHIRGTDRLLARTGVVYGPDLEPVGELIQPAAYRGDITRLIHGGSVYHVYSTDAGIGVLEGGAVQVDLGPGPVTALAGYSMLAPAEEEARDVRGGCLLFIGQGHTIHVMAIDADDDPTCPTPEPWLTIPTPGTPSVLAVGEEALFIDSLDRMVPLHVAAVVDYRVTVFTYDVSSNAYRLTVCIPAAERVPHHLFCSSRHHALFTSDHPADSTRQARFIHWDETGDGWHWETVSATQVRALLRKTESFCSAAGVYTGWLPTHLPPDPPSTTPKGTPKGTPKQRSKPPTPPDPTPGPSAPPLIDVTGRGQAAVDLVAVAAAISRPTRNTRAVSGCDPVLRQLRALLGVEASHATRVVGRVARIFSSPGVGVTVAQEDGALMYYDTRLLCRTVVATVAVVADIINRKVAALDVPPIASHTPLLIDLLASRCPLLAIGALHLLLHTSCPPPEAPRPPAESPRAAVTALAAVIHAHKSGVPSPIDPVAVEAALARHGDTTSQLVYLAARMLAPTSPLASVMPLLRVIRDPWFSDRVQRSNVVVDVIAAQCIAKEAPFTEFLALLPAMLTGQEGIDGWTGDSIVTRLCATRAAHHLISGVIEAVLTADGAPRQWTLLRLIGQLAHVDLLDRKCIACADLPNDIVVWVVQSGARLSKAWPAPGPPTFIRWIKVGPIVVAASATAAAVLLLHQQKALQVLADVSFSPALRTPVFAIEWTSKRKLVTIVLSSRAVPVWTAEVAVG